MLKLALRDVETMLPNIETIGIDDKVVAYRILEGEYSGVAYTYANIQFNVIDVESGALAEYKPDEIDPNDPRYALQVGFEYIILENPNDITVEVQPFKEYIGQTLITIIEGSIDDE